MNTEILVVGLNHRTAPVEVRERITYPGNSNGQMTRLFLEIDGVSEALIISTCNRAEVVVAGTCDERTLSRILDTVSTIHDIPREFFENYLYSRQGAEAVSHIFRVAASLDSMVLGEPQILGQVKEGYRLAASVNATGPILNRLMHRAFFTAKRVRTETGVGLAGVSVAYVAVELAKKILGNLQDKAVLLVGAGEMAELAARHLSSQVRTPPVIVNRTIENACTLAGMLNGLARGMDQLEDCLAQTDVAITSTGSCETLITSAHMTRVMRRRRNKPIFIIDIAVPRDVEISVNDIDGVYLYNIDDLQSVVAENVEERSQEAIRAETIVAEETAKFIDWSKCLDSTPTIVAIRRRLEEIRANELARSNGKLSSLNPAQREAVEMITKSIINKIAHDPIAFLKRAKSRPKRNLYLDIAQRMFNVSDSACTPDLGEESSSRK